MELLAPAGNMESFRAAVQAGADAVYAGAPAMNARNLARDLRLEEIAAMIQYCREHGLKCYLAANSLIREQDLHQVVETLAILEGLRPDALIVQDLGLIRLVRDFFPGLILHASTLMAAHNRETIRAFADLGLTRVVLARELTLREITAICQKSPVEIEVFVHGAMCFSYSGLCLFSSFLGGKSGLRGRCVQPCRRQYTWEEKGGKRSGGRSGARDRKKEGGEPSGSRGGGKGAYLFSMNDLNGLAAVPALAEVGVASLKIEGRLRTAHYVSHVVQAYRIVIDAVSRFRGGGAGGGETMPDTGLDEFTMVLEQARMLVERAMSRKIGPGYFYSPQPPEAITPYHSGNAGLHLGRLDSVRQGKGVNQGRLILKDELEVGDRLRLHLESSGERHSFTLQEMVRGEEPVEKARAGETVWISLRLDGIQPGRPTIDCYKVDVRSRPQGSDAPIGLPEHRRMKELVVGILGARREKIALVRRQVCLTEEKEAHLPPVVRRGKGDGKPRTEQRKTGPSRVRLPLEWWLKTDAIKLLGERLPFTPDRFLVPVDKLAVSQVGQIRRFMGAAIGNLTWCLPPILFETELAQVHKQLFLLIRSGFKHFQLGHISQAWMFHGQRVHLACDHTIAIMNHLALGAVARLGAEAAQLSIEADRRLLADIAKSSRADTPRIRKGLTVYGAPALFTARLAARHFQYDRVLTSPKGESFTIHRKDGLVRATPCRPFSLLPYLGELRDMGVDYVVVDLCHLATGATELQTLADRLAGTGRVSKLPTFNYLGTLE